MAGLARSTSKTSPTNSSVLPVAISGRLRKRSWRSTAITLMPYSLRSRRRQCLIGQDRAGQHAQASLALVEPVISREIGQGVSRFHGRAVLVGAEPAPRQQHVANPEQQDRQADGREVEEGEALEAGAAQFAVDHQVRRRRHQGQHAADEAGKGQRHQQAPRRDLHAVGDTQHHGNEDGHHAGGAHHRAEPGDRQHQQHQQARFAAARGAISQSPRR